MAKKEDEEEEKDDKLFRLDKLLGEVEDIEKETYGVKKRGKVKNEEGEVDLPEPIQLKPLPKKPEEVKKAEVVKPTVEEPKEEQEQVVLDENGEPCDQCTIAAKKFIEDKFCSLVDDEEKKETCIAEAMKIVVQVKSGKISMHEFEKKVKEIGQKYISDWEPDDDGEIIPPETKEELGKDD